MKKFSSLCFLLLCAAGAVFSQNNAAEKSIIIKLKTGERWWGGAVAYAHKGHFGASLIQ